MSALGRPLELGRPEGSLYARCLKVSSNTLRSIKKAAQPRFNQLDHDGVVVDLVDLRLDPAVALPALASPWAPSPQFHRKDKDVHESARCQWFPSFTTRIKCQAQRATRRRR